MESGATWAVCASVALLVCVAIVALVVGVHLLSAWSAIGKERREDE